MWTQVFIQKNSNMWKEQNFVMEFCSFFAFTTLQKCIAVLELVRQKSKEKQSRNLRVKCLSDGELSMERKEESCGADFASRCYK